MLINNEVLLRAINFIGNAIFIYNYLKKIMWKTHYLYNIILKVSSFFVTITKISDLYWITYKSFLYATKFVKYCISKRIQAFLSIIKNAK